MVRLAVTGQGGFGGVNAFAWVMDTPASVSSRKAE